MKTNTERINHIKNALNAAKDDKDRVRKYIPWRGKNKLFNAVTIDIDFLMYRINNSRTMWQQMAYIEKNKKDKNFFNDPESEETQNAQSEILEKMLEKSGDQFIIDLIQKGQEDPAIITYEGYVINGNRRLAAIRNIPEISHMDCIVLPTDATEKDFYEIEQVLQLSQDFKEDYHWINELSNISSGIFNFQYPVGQVAARLRIDEKDVKIKLQMFELLKEFLVWKRLPKRFDYSILDDKEQAFVQLAKETNKTRKYNPEEIEELKQLSFVLIEKPPESGRLYTHLNNLYRTYKKLRVRLIKNRDIKIETLNENEKHEPNPLLEDVADALGNRQGIRFNPDTSANNSPIIMESISDILAEEKDIKESETVYRLVGDALRLLTSITITNEFTKLGGAKNKLKQIIEISRELISKIEELD